MTPRGTDWGLAALVALLGTTGALTLFAGSSSDAWVFAAHDALGIAIALLVAVKLRRVWARIVDAGDLGAGTTAGLAGAALVLAAMISGVAWATGADISPAGYSLLSWHDALGAVLVIAIAVHMVVRAKPLRARDLAHRRQFFAAAGIALGSFAGWRAQKPFEAIVALKGAKRRFTGSYEAGSFAGNAFPSTSWVADNPRPIASAGYRLGVTGLVRTELKLATTDLDAGDELTATLDCTGGFYSTQQWHGISLQRLIDHAGPTLRASHLSVVSVTGYRWGFALSDARGLLLATRVGDEPLSHEHGAPVRLVVPGARGFQWVKWVTRIELLDHPDYGAPASTVLSSFTSAI